MSHHPVTRSSCFCLLVLFAYTASAGGQSIPEPPKGAPAYQAPVRPDDGTHMALTVEKLRQGFDPPRPLLVWAIGSSFTNGLGNGARLKGLIRERFPDAPEIVYKKQAGCSTSYHYCRGWAQHLVIPDQPDVVLLYNFGKPEELEQLIVDLRRHTTADILVGTLHWVTPQKPVWPDPDAKTTHQDFAAMRTMCRRLGVEFVENRRELTEYMRVAGLVPDDMLGDSVHETRFAADCTVQNIARHFHAAEKPGDDPRWRERRIGVASPKVTLTGEWASADDGSARQTTAGSFEVAFTGNRIDLIGKAVPGGGKAAVLIDGKAGGEVPVFYTSYVQPDRKNAPKPPMPPRDRCPHAVGLGPAEKIVPQQWTITMTSDTGDYQLVGSETGADGAGNSAKPLTSNSGQITIDPAMWRAAKTNRTGDRFTFEVIRCVVGEIDFAAEQPRRFRLRVAQNLSNGPHKLRLIGGGSGPITVEALDVFEPPLK